MTKKILSKLICLCLAVCTVISASTYVYAEEADTASEGTIHIVVLKEDVKKGEKISSNILELVEVKNVNIPDNVLTEINQASLKYATQDLCAGDYIYDAQVASQPGTSSSKDVLVQEIRKSNNAFLVVSDYVMPNTGEDVTVYLQSLISKNPGRTLYFPDGEYIISSSLYTASEGASSTTFYFSSNAILKASDHWSSIDGRDALICLGTKKSDGTHVNDNTSNGSYFGVFGGVLDCNNKADGISVISSRESVIYGTTILNPETGINIFYGANSSSSDADIENVTIIGTKKSGSIGIYNAGNDNTMTDVKIYDMEVGIKAEKFVAARNIQCFQTGIPADNPRYSRTVGIEGHGWLLDCYVENYATAYRFTADKIIIEGLTAAWTQPYATQLAFEWITSFNSRMAECRADFYDSTSNNIFIKAAQGGAGRIDPPILNTAYENNGAYKRYIYKNEVLDLA